MIRIRNKGRAPQVLELSSLGKLPQAVTTVLNGERHEVLKSFPQSITIPARGLSGMLPDAVRNDPVLAGRNIEIVEAGKPPKES